MYCPFCNPHCDIAHKIDNNLRECPNCHHRIRRFSLHNFLRKKAPFFTIIGVLGTMLSLLPNLMDKLYSSPYSIPGIDYNVISTSLVDNDCFPVKYSGDVTVIPCRVSDSSKRGTKFSKSFHFRDINLSIILEGILL